MGVTFDDTEKKFVFDFEHDGAEDVVSLTGNGYQVEAFGKCFYYGYEFSELVDGSVRSSFIKYVKSTKDFQATPDLTNFIKKAIDNLDKHINLFNYDLVLFPKLRSRECQYMLLYIYRFNQPRLYNYEDVLANPMDEKLYATIRKQNVLVIDDVTTSGSTLNEILRSLRIVNDDNNITIFSLIGRKDLMADIFSSFNTIRGHNFIGYVLVLICVYVKIISNYNCRLP